MAVSCWYCCRQGIRKVGCLTWHDVETHTGFRRTNSLPPEP